MQQETEKQEAVQQQEAVQRGGTTLPGAAMGARKTQAPTKRSIRGTSSSILPCSQDGVRLCVGLCARESGGCRQATFSCQTAGGKPHLPAHRPTHPPACHLPASTSS
jgi:hypothetical protein